MENNFTIELIQLEDHRFEARFDNPAVPVLITDENAPLGGDAGPNPARLLAVAVANCLAASLLFAMRKFKNQPQPLRAVAHVTKGRNAQNRLRVKSIRVGAGAGQTTAPGVTSKRSLAPAYSKNERSAKKCGDPAGSPP